MRIRKAQLRDGTIIVAPADEDDTEGLNAGEDSDVSFVVVLDDDSYDMVDGNFVHWTNTERTENTVIPVERQVPTLKLIRPLYWKRRQS